MENPEIKFDLVTKGFNELVFKLIKSLNRELDKNLTWLLESDLVDKPYNELLEEFDSEIWRELI